jgi:uncharacterized protein YqhQ
MTIGGISFENGVAIIGKQVAYATRDKNGDIQVTTYKRLNKDFLVLKIPLLNLVISLFWQLYTGARIMLKEELKDNYKSDKPVFVMCCISALFAIFLLIFLPSLISTLIFYNMLHLNLLITNIVEASIRSSIMLYLMLKIDKSTRLYHGAEHKIIGEYELYKTINNVENLKKISKNSPKCGTCITVIALIISAPVFYILGQHGLMINVLLRVILTPVILVISDKIRRVKLFNIFGVGMQHFTVGEPTQNELEVVAKAFVKAIN